MSPVKVTTPLVAVIIPESTLILFKVVIPLTFNSPIDPKSVATTPVS